MENLFGEAKVVGSEDIEDRDPNLYAKRSEEALREGRYNDAVFEIDKAIEYSGRNIEYIYQKVKILFAIGSYRECYNLIHTDIKNNLSYFNEREEDQIYKYSGKCYKKCNISTLPDEWIILTPEGDGMYSSISEAINATKGHNKKIYLTEGIYYENLVIKSNVYIDGYNAEIESNSSRYGISLKHCSVNISNVNMRNISKFKSSYGVYVYEGCIIFKNCSITNENGEGIYIGDKSEVRLTNSTIRTGERSVASYSSSICNISESLIESKSESAGISCRGILNITNCDITVNKDDESKAIELASNNGIQCKVKVNGCKIKSSGYSIYSFEDTILEIDNTKIYSSDIGIFVGGQMKLKSSTLNDNNKGIVAHSGKSEIIDCQILKNNESGIDIYNTENMDITNCNIRGNQFGVAIRNGMAQIRQSNIYGNKRSGVLNRGKGSKIISSKVYDNGEAGVYCYNNGSIEVNNSNIYCNKQANIQVSNSGVLVAKECYISSGSSSGVYSYENGLCNLTGCNIYNNAGKGLETDSSGVINNYACKVHDNESLIGSLSSIRRFFKGI
ncbi:right-handed parallel beta-helix repeat-containing protein [Terrisporobacter petrolearius]|uniref:right-handed parallel beta-helix repeat-containing protein n=1 Tax=Terrisporobacter petrolearius TaxID=1460447 RepID=UPI0031CC6AA2